MNLKGNFSERTWEPHKGFAFFDQPSDFWKDKLLKTMSKIRTNILILKFIEKIPVIYPFVSGILVLGNYLKYFIPNA